MARRDWLEDVRLMREAGVNLVSMGIFSWTRMEPHPDEYDFEWIDRLMDLLHEHRVSVTLPHPPHLPQPGLFTVILRFFPLQPMEQPCGMARVVTTVRQPGLS